MTNQFDPTLWSKGSQLMDTAREKWESSTFAATQAQPVSGDASVPLDVTLKEATAALRLAWYDQIGAVGVRMGSDSSKMSATAQNYATTEEQAVAANERFWE